MSGPKKRGLGRGLDALLGSGAAPEAGEELRELPLDQLSPGRHQPRRHFEAEALEELAVSIRAQGVVQPIVVRPLPGGRYEIVAGERRWRAAGVAGLNTIPAVVRELDERAAMTVALVENIQRADLNPLEEAEALQRLIADCGLTHEQAATAVGRKRASVTNLLRLTELAAEVQALLRDGALSLGHAKVLLGTEGEHQTELARQVVARQLSVRQLEQLVDGAALPPAEPKTRLAPPAESALAQALGLPVRMQQNARGRGRITIEFRNARELDALLRRIDPSLS